MPSRGRALTILDISQLNWTFDKRAFNSVLSKCGDRPVAIYSMNGVTRSGKSFLLNYFIRYFEGQLGNSEDEIGSELFRSESGLGRVTVGINLWSKPYFVQTDGGRVAVLLLDTQGLFDQNTTYRQNAIIFTVSSLLSSVMMFNQKGLMTEDVLQNVERFSNFTNNIVYQRNLRVPVPSSDSNIGAASSLLFLMRDFELPDYKFGYHSLVKNPQGSNGNFFQDTLGLEVNNNEIRAGVENEIGEENRLVREQLQELYPLLATYLLPHPGNQFVRQRIANANPDAEFQAEAQLFVERTVSRNHLVTKKIRGQVVTGRRFIYCITSIEAILNEADTHFSDLKSMREYDAATQYLRVMNAAGDFYKSELDHFISHHPEGVPENEFVEKDKDAFERAVIKFERESINCIHDPMLKQRYRCELETRINNLFHQLQNTNNGNRKRTEKNKLYKNVAIGVGIGVGALAVVGTAIVLTGPVGVVTVIATAEGTGAGVAATGAGVAATGAGVAATGAGVAATGAGVAATGAGVAATGAGVAATGAGAAATGAGVAATGSGIAAVGASVTTRAAVGMVSRATFTVAAGVAGVAGGAAGGGVYYFSNPTTTHSETPRRT